MYSGTPKYTKKLKKIGLAFSLGKPTLEQSGALKVYLNKTEIQIFISNCKMKVLYLQT